MQLTLLTFPQSWDGAAIALRVLVLPKGDPFEPLAAGAPAFVSASLRLNAAAIPSLDRLPASIDASAPKELALTQPAERLALFEALRGSFEFEPVPSPTNPRPAGSRIRKYLTESYRSAFRFERPRRPEFAGIDNSFECALIDPAIGEKPRRPVPGKEVRWGQVLGFVLRQPVLARELGLLYETVFTPDAGTFDAGGWLYVELHPAGPFAAAEAADPAMVGRYAARIPPLAAPRALFAAVQFPVHGAAPPPFDPELLLDAQEYDDGFAKIVHGAQPKTAALFDSTPAEPRAAAKRPMLSPSAPPAAKEAGIRLGWDDEQVAIWLNRLLVQDPANPQHSPVTVGSYRVDVRLAGIGGAWTPLNLVEGVVRLGGLSAGPFRGELGIETLPVQLEGRKTGDFWLPSYFTTWAGASLALGNLQALDFAEAAAERPARPYAPVGLDAVPLRYGSDYEFRVRLADLSGGGPDSSREPLNPGPAPTTTVAFRRYVRPKPVRVTAEAGGAYSVARPLLGFPEIAFTGRPNFAADLTADLSVARDQQREPGLPDPYVTSVRIDVSVKSPAGDVDEYRPVYTTTRAFPADAGEPFTLQIDYRDAPDIAAFGPVAPAGAVPVPSARDVRIALTPLCDDPDLERFGDSACTEGAVPFYISARQASRDETALWAPRTPASQVQMIFMQPDPPPTAVLAEGRRAEGMRAAVPADIAGRLAQQIGMGLTGLTLVPPKGVRLVFGCSSKLPHTLAPDRSSLQLSSRTDLQRIWIGAIRMRLARDWTWDGFAPAALKVTRTLDGSVEEAGVVDLPRAVSPRALETADRTGTEILFLDAWDGKPPAGQPIREHQVRYTVTPVFRDPPELPAPDSSWEVRVPVTTPPSQTPKLISAGIALSPYAASGDYSSTVPRERRLWLEFDAPPLDEHDLYFARVLAYSPDPILMMPGEAIPEPEEPPLPIDPEWITVVHPDQPADAAGYEAMQPLERGARIEPLSAPASEGSRPRCSGAVRALGLRASSRP